jgi:hypothetical protein
MWASWVVVCDWLLPKTSPVRGGGLCYVGDELWVGVDDALRVAVGLCTAIAHDPGGAGYRGFLVNPDMRWLSGSLALAVLGSGGACVCAFVVDWARGCWEE